MDDYDFIYQMEVSKEIEPNWFKLKWKWIKKGTYNFYAFKNFKKYQSKGIGFRFYDISAHNGWGRFWDGKHFELWLFIFEINFWIRWNIKVMAEGPIDSDIKRPLDISKCKRLSNDERKDVK